MNKLKKVSIFAAIVLVFGILLASVGFVLGGFSPLHIGRDGIDIGNDSNATHIDEKLPEFKNIEIDIDAMTLELKEGSEYKIYGSQEEYNNSLNYSVKNGTLYINQKFEDGDWIDLFGWSSYDEVHITIEYPKGAEFDNVTLDNDAADIFVEKLVTNRLSIKVDAGNCELDDVKAKIASLDVSAGSLYADNFETDALEGECDAGDIEIEGVFRGLTEFDCDAGTISMLVKAPEKYYGYIVESNFADVEVNGEEYRGPVMSDSKNQIKIETDAGSVYLDFAE